MGKTYLGARRKRTNSPVENRKRAVEYRHQRYAKAVLPEIEDTEIREPAEIIAETVAETAAETAAEAAAETAAREAVYEADETPAETAVPAEEKAGGFIQKITAFFMGLFGIRKAVDAIDAAAEETYTSEEPAEEPAVEERVSDLTETVSDEAEAGETAEETEAADTADTEPAAEEAVEAHADDEETETIGEWPAM